MHGAEYDEMNEMLDQYRDKFESVAVAEPLLGEWARMPPSSMLTRKPLPSCYRCRCEGSRLRQRRCCRRR